MFERAQMRVLPITNRAADYAPIAPACCNACRVCAASGAIGLAFAAGGGVVAALTAFGRRLLRRS